MRAFVAVVGAGLVLLVLSVTAARDQAPRPTPTIALATATHAPTPTAPASPRGRAVVYVSAPVAPPLAIDDPAGIEGTDTSSRVYYRLAHLWAYRGPVPVGYADPAAVVKARPYRIGIAGDLAVVTFLVPAGGWAIDAAQVKMLLQQVVFTVTEEPGIERVRLREEGSAPGSDPEEGPPIVIVGTRVPLILTRELVLR